MFIPTQYTLVVIAIVATLVANAGPARANTDVRVAWQSQYPLSQSYANGGCNLCHGGMTSKWNSYGWRIRFGIRNDGKTITQAIVDAASLDSDGDPGAYSNLAEIAANTQPGWRQGATNVVYNADGTFVTGQSAPASIAGSLDPAVTTTTTVTTTTSTTTTSTTTSSTTTTTTATSSTSTSTTTSTSTSSSTSSSTASSSSTTTTSEASSTSTNSSSSSTTSEPPTSTTTTLASCGNGVLDPGEQCDPAGAGSDCCTAGCTFAPADTRCGSDDDLCTTDRCDAAGTCLHVAEPDTGCLEPTIPGKASLIIRNPADAAPGDAVTFKWGVGPDVALGDFGPAPDMGDPTYALCVYDTKGPTTTRAFRGQASVGDCAGTPCWTVSAGAWKFKSKSGVPDGLVALTLKAGTLGKAKIRVKAKGPVLALPELPLAQGPTVVAQLRASSGRCWGATFSTHAKNAPPKFVGKSD